jgi:hypothetical protein
MKLVVLLAQGAASLNASNDLDLRKIKKGHSNGLFLLKRL